MAVSLFVSCSQGRHIATASSIYLEPTLQRSSISATTANANRDPFLKTYLHAFEGQAPHIIHTSIVTSPTAEALPALSAPFLKPAFLPHLPLNLPSPPTPLSLFPKTKGLCLPDQANHVSSRPSTPPRNSGHREPLRQVWLDRRAQTQPHSL